MSQEAAQINVSSPAQALTRQLSQFGLNPQDWAVVPMNSGDYCAIHKRDHELVLVGNVCQRQAFARWKSLELLDDEVFA